MPLYPLPLLLAIVIWVGIFISTGTKMMLSGLVVISLGLIAYFIATSEGGSQALTVQSWISTIIDSFNRWIG